MKTKTAKQSPGGDELAMIEKLEFWPIEKLRPYGKNSRTHSEDQIAELAASFVEFGVCQPIAVHEDIGIVAGEGRYLAGRLLKLSRLPVINLSHLTKSKARAYVIADNRLPENAGWNKKVLIEELKEIHEAGDVELKSLGYTDDELVEMLPELAPEQVEDKDTGGSGGGSSAEIPKHPVSRLGDLFILGDHRLLCGNSLEKSDVLRLMEGSKADIVFTDPPYNLQGAGRDKFTNRGGDGAKRKKIADWDEGFQPKKFTPAMLTVIKKDCSVFVCTSNFLFGEFTALLKDAGAEMSFLVWCKNNPMPSLMKTTFVTAAEIIVHARFGTPYFKYPDQGNLPNFFNGSVEPHSSGHPTQKPTYVPAYCVDHTTKPGDLVADFFAGSGTTLIHCEKTKRRCNSLEIEPAYCDLILDRWAFATGKDPVRADGTPWSRLKKRK